MRIAFWLASAAYLCCAGHAAVPSEEPVEDCLIAFGAGHGPSFASAPAPAAWNGAPAPVDLASASKARQYRTMLRNGAKSGPNFAGHYTIVGWGCGSSCLNWAVVDAKTGKVHFAPNIQVVATNHVGEDDPKAEASNTTFNALRFRRDSALLVVLGAPNEDLTRDGISYYRWTGISFKLLRFVPLAQACRPVD